MKHSNKSIIILYKGYIINGDDNLRDKLIRIYWHRPMFIENAIESDIALNHGLYYITRKFGTNETSLYIGKASRTIKERIITHDNEWVHRYRGKIFVRMGKIIYPHTVDADIIDHAESALIYEHSDILADNTDKVKSYTYTDLYRIENTGYHYELLSSFRMHDHPDY